MVAHVWHHFSPGGTTFPLTSVGGAGYAVPGSGAAGGAHVTSLKSVFPVRK